MARGNLRNPLIYFLTYLNLRKGTMVFYCTWRMIIGCPVEYPQMSRGCHESCHCLLLAYMCVCVWERENGRSTRERVGGGEVCTYRAAHWFARTVRSLARILATSPEHVASGNGGWRRWKWNLSGIRGIVSVFMIWYQLSFLTRRCRVPSFASLRQASWNFTPNYRFIELEIYQLATV